MRADLLAALSRSPAALRISRPLPGRLLNVQASADGRTLLVGNNGGAVAVIDTKSGRTIYVHNSDAYVTMASDGAPLVLSPPGPTTTITELARDSDQVTRTVTYPMRNPWSIGWAPDLSTIAAVTPNGRELFVYETATMKVVRRIDAPAGMMIANVNGFTGGHLLLTEAPGSPVGSDSWPDRPGIETWWGPRGSTPIATFHVAHAGTTYSASPDGAMLAFDNVPVDGHETLLDTRTGRSREVAGQHTAGIVGSSFSPDGRTLVTGGDDLVARVWDVRTGALLQTLTGHDGKVFAPAVTAVDGEETAWTVSLDGSLIAWDLTGDRRFGDQFAGANGVDTLGLGGIPHPAISTSPDGRFLALSASDGTVIADTATHAVVRHFRTVLDGAAPSAAAWSPDGTRLAVTGDEKSVATLYDTTTWSPVGGGPLVGPTPERPPWPGEVSPDSATIRLPNAARQVAFSADSSRLVAGTAAGELWTWDARSGSPIGAPIQAAGDIQAVAIDPATGWIAAGLAGLGRAKRLRPGLVGPRFSVDVDGGYGIADAIAFSPDGKTLATGGGTGDVRLWDASSGSPIGRHILASAGWVTSIAWSADGQQLLTGGTDGTVRLIDVASESVSGSLPGESNLNVGVAFSADGRDVLASYDGGLVFDWQIGTADWASNACAVAGRTLTQDEWDQYLPGRPYQPACVP